MCRYHGSKKAAEAKLPFDAGFESVSIVAAIGPGVKGESPRGVSAVFELYYYLDLSHILPCVCLSCIHAQGLLSEIVWLP